MQSFVRTTLFTALWVPALIMRAGTVQAAPQQPGTGPSVSLERIREELEKAPPLRLKPSVPVQLPPTFKSRVERRPFVPTLEEHLHKQFDLTPLQRQSAEWASRCCGFDLGILVNHAQKALRERKIRKTREQIRRELAELEEARAVTAQVK